MAKLNSNIFGRASGNLGGINFSKATGKKGTVQTARQVTERKDANSEAQQRSRTALSLVQDVIRQFGREYYIDFFSDTASQKSAYVVFLSFLMRNVNRSETPILFDKSWSWVQNGSLHYPVSMHPYTEEGTNVFMRWSTELGENGSASDRIVAYYLAQQYNQDGILITDAAPFGEATRAEGEMPLLTVPAIETFETVAFFMSVTSPQGIVPMRAGATKVFNLA